MKSATALRWPRAFQLAARWLGFVVVVLLLWGVAWAKGRPVPDPLVGGGVFLAVVLVGARLAHRSWKVPAAFLMLALLVVAGWIALTLGSEGTLR